MENRFIRAEDVAQELNVSKPYGVLMHFLKENQEYTMILICLLN